MDKQLYSAAQVKRCAQNFVRYLHTECRLPVRQAFLFGSYAQGRPRLWSDVDICVVSPKFKNSASALEYLNVRRRRSDILHGIEPHGFTVRDFADNSNPLVAEIKKNGIRIV